jgi:hypothetical protein
MLSIVTAVIIPPTEAGVVYDFFSWDKGEKEKPDYIIRLQKF